LKAPGTEREAAVRGQLRAAEALLLAALLLVAGAELTSGEEDGPPVAARDLAVRIDVNESPWYELTYLPGIGEVRAKEIVRSREVSGPFETLGDLVRVRGIGPATVRQIEDYLWKSHRSRKSDTKSW
jgi:competence protein ComEA